MASCLKEKKHDSFPSVIYYFNYAILFYSLYSFHFSINTNHLVPISPHHLHTRINQYKIDSQSIKQTTRQQHPLIHHFPVEGVDETESASPPFCALNDKDSISRSCLYASKFYIAPRLRAYHRVPVRRHHFHRASGRRSLAGRHAGRKGSEGIADRRSRSHRSRASLVVELGIFGFVVVFALLEARVLLANALVEGEELRVGVLGYDRRGNGELPRSELRWRSVRRISSMVISYSFRIVLMTDS